MEEKTVLGQEWAWCWYGECWVAATKMNDVPGWHWRNPSSSTTTSQISHCVLEAACATRKKCFCGRERDEGATVVWTASALVNVTCAAAVIWCLHWIDVHVLYDSETMAARTHTD